MSLPRVLFSPVTFSRYDSEESLPSRFARLLAELDMKDAVRDKLVAIKMHVGRRIGYSTIHPLFVKILVDHLKEAGARVFITDQEVRDARPRGYTEEYLGCPVVDVCGVTGKYYYEKQVDFKSFKNVDVAGHIMDADVLINLSHVKGHGSCGLGGAVKNIAMGCVTDRTRGQIHSLEGGIEWDAEKCTHCGACISSCNHDANAFDAEGIYRMNYHHCTVCQHCVKVCPTGAIVMNANQYDDFQMGMALCTQKCLEHFDPQNIFYINFMLNITALCDCWGMTTPNLVPDIGVAASRDIVAIERACLDMIRVEDFIPAGIPKGFELSGKGHLFDQIHGRDPYVQLRALEGIGMGSQGYELCTIE